MHTIGRVIKAIIVQESISTLRMINPDIIPSVDAEVITWLQNYVEDHGGLPTFNTVVRTHALRSLLEAVLFEPSEPASAIAQEYIVSVALKKHLDHLQQLVNDSWTEQTFPSGPEYIKLMREVAFGKETGQAYSEASIDIFKGLPVIADWGIPIFDTASRQIRSKSFNIIAGQTNAGKTMYICWLATRLIAIGRRVLFVSGEMGKEQIMSRIAGFASKMSPSKFIEIEELDPIEAEKVEAAFKSHTDLVKATGGELVIYERTDLKFGIDSLLEIVDSGGYDIVLIDGLYLLRPPDQDGEWQNFLSLSNKTKSTALATGVPILATTQLKRGADGTSTDDLGYSNAFSQDADCIVSLVPSDDEDYEDLNVVVARLIKNRFGPTDFSVFLTINEEPFDLTIGAPTTW